MAEVKINVEYCGSCGHKRQFLEMADLIRQAVPSAEILGIEGRQASFEVQVNNELVFSKLQTLAFPNFSCVSELVKDVYDGKPIRKVDKQQPIDCALS